MTPILATKLYIPPLRKNVVSRPRLIERLNEGLCRDQGFGPQLTLISAPAGFGKTTLVSEWVAGCDRRVAWLSLDEGDSDPARFLTYLVAALQTVAPDIGEGVLRVLQRCAASAGRHRSDADCSAQRNHHPSGQLSCSSLTTTT